MRPRAAARFENRSHDPTGLLKLYLGAWWAYQVYIWVVFQAGVTGRRLSVRVPAATLSLLMLINLIGVWIYGPLAPDPTGVDVSSSITQLLQVCTYLDSLWVEVVPFVRPERCELAPLPPTEEMKILAAWVAPLLTPSTLPFDTRELV